MKSPLFPLWKHLDSEIPLRVNEGHCGTFLLGGPIFSFAYSHKDQYYINFRKNWMNKIKRMKIEIRLCPLLKHLDSGTPLMYTVGLSRWWLVNCCDWYFITHSSFDFSLQDHCNIHFRKNGINIIKRMKMKSHFSHFGIISTRGLLWCTLWDSLGGDW